MINIPLPDELAKQLEEIARQQNRSVADILATWLDEHKEETEKPKGIPNWDLILGVYDDDVTDMSTTVRETLQEYFKKNMAILIDTSFLLAAFYVKDQYYIRARSVIQSVLDSTVCIVPAPVHQELFYMATARMGYTRGIDTCERVIAAGFEIQPLLDEDLLRLLAIGRQYASASFDYADTAIMALSERLNITQVYTFDRRDFSVFRPKHCAYLELLP